MDPSAPRPSPRHPAPVVIHRAARPVPPPVPIIPAWRSWWHGSLKLVGSSILIFILGLIIESSVLPGSPLAVLSILASVCSLFVLLISPLLLLIAGLVIICYGAIFRGLLLILPAALLLAPHLLKSHAPAPSWQPHGNPPSTTLPPPSTNLWK